MIVRTTLVGVHLHEIEWALVSASWARETKQLYSQSEATLKLQVGEAKANLEEHQNIEFHSDLHQMD